MSYSFFATVSRMKYIDRWALMRNARAENLSEHSLEVAMIAHALCVIGNTRYGKSLNAEKAALIGLYHDASEIITGDMPTPVKYYTTDLRRAYHEVEAVAEDQLLRMLPEDLRGSFAAIFTPEEDENDQYLRRLVKAADKFSALIKCMEEKEAGNLEFRTAELTTRESIEKMGRELPEVKDFMIEFLPSYGNTLDELIGKGDSK